MERAQSGRDCTGTSGQLTERAWVRWGAAGAVAGMLSWVVGLALVPLNAKLEDGNQHLANVLAAHSAQLNAAALLAVLGAALLAGFLVVLTLVVPAGRPGSGLLRVSLATCIITQTMVAVGVSFLLAGVHTAVTGGDAALAALGWRAMWLTFLSSAIPTIMFTVTGVIGLRRAGLSPPWVSALGSLSAAAHLLALFTLAQRGPFAPDGIIASLTPLTTVIWIIALAARLPGCWRTAAASAPAAPSGT